MILYSGHILGITYCSSNIRLHYATSCTAGRGPSQGGPYT